VLTWPLTLLVVIFPITGVTSAVARLQWVLCPVVPAGSGTEAVAQVRRGPGGGAAGRFGSRPNQAAAQQRAALAIACSTAPAPPPAPLRTPLTAPRPAPPQQPPLWPWYCDNDSVVAAFTRSIVTGWLPALLLNLWLVMVLPRLVYLVVQVGGQGGGWGLGVGGRGQQLL
jgi:hypothetical protein